MSEARILRARQIEIRAAIDAIPTDDDTSSMAAVVELVANPTWPTTGNVYAAQCVQISGDDEPGSDAVFTKYGPIFNVINLGTGRPPDPALGVATRTICVGQFFEYYT